MTYIKVIKPSVK